jgi:hypothetical protein
MACAGSLSLLRFVLYLAHFVAFIVEGRMEIDRRFTIGI